MPADEAAAPAVPLWVGDLGRRVDGEDGGADDAPRAARAVDRRRLEGVIHLEPQHELPEAAVDQPADRTHDEGAPEGEGGAAGGDRDEAGEDAVAHGRHVIAAALAEGERRQQRSQAARRRGDGCVCDDASDDGRVVAAREGEPRARVEAVPAEPEDESAEDLQHRRVPRHRQRDAETALGKLLEAAVARADDDRPAQPGGSSGQVDDAGAGEVDHAALEGVRVGGGEPALGGPDPVHDDWVDEDGDEHRVGEVGEQVRPLRHRAGDDGCCGGGEGPLEPPEQIAVPRVVRIPVAGREEGGGGEADLAADEAVAAVECDGVPHHPPQQAGDASVEEVLEQDGLSRAGGDRPGLEHAEAALHEEHHEPRAQQEKRVARRSRDVRKGRARRSRRRRRVETSLERFDAQQQLRFRHRRAL
mmetsp:Transcript_14982/g.44439  ORF Transcript_14982/g.44439 Transcript_14982/m.44439 type:complete len:417 (-) Transcript_14982:56-1306(-)